MTRSINLNARLTMEYLYRKKSNRNTQKKPEYWESKLCFLISDTKKLPKTWRLKLRPLRVSKQNNWTVMHA